MKKSILYLFAVLAIVSSLAFHPKPTTEAGYMLLTLHTGGRPALVSISPTGEQQQYPLLKKAKGSYDYHAQLMLKLNELRQQGWTVVQMQTTEAVVPDIQYPLLGPDKFATLTFLLEKR
ncbi:hypothetical protein [Hymenobacter canadensis]|uniref:DUF4177 domain-containing protein n=1 Tax=Hymenobacter canadensis TaxID=2999067 RepID=A0ABY7LJ33_9BACT|nr:hypothetical protein [Hymenobacter canadensis]WBA40460.1 hypothetical protein O3303_11530 [Hymenobacter canadensis]